MGAVKMLNDADLRYLVALADTAGEAIMAVYEKRDELQHAVKADKSPLTAADLASNEILVLGLQTRWPHIPILSEESVNTFTNGEQPELYWAVRTSADLVGSRLRELDVECR